MRSGNKKGSLGDAGIDEGTEVVLRTRWKVARERTSETCKSAWAVEEIFMAPVSSVWFVLMG
jgi:hypothetical protein